MIKRLFLAIDGTVCFSFNLALCWTNENDRDQISRQREFASSCNWSVRRRIVEFKVRGVRGQDVE